MIVIDYFQIPRVTVDSDRGSIRFSMYVIDHRHRKVLDERKIDFLKMFVSYPDNIIIVQMCKLSNDLTSCIKNIK